MEDPFEFDDEQWVEICDADGKRSAMRLLATIGFGGKNYFILGAHGENEDGDEERGLILLREDQTIDGAQEYVIADDEDEIENVVGRFVMQSIARMIEKVIPDIEADNECACGVKHRPGEFCVCGETDYLQ